MDEKTLNEAADTVIKQLPDHIGEHIRNLSTEFVVPLWQFVCGLLYDSYQIGRLSAFQLDPAWKDGYRHEQYTCQHCGKHFKATRINQVYCSNACGNKAKEIQDGITAADPNETELDTDGSDLVGDTGPHSPSSEDDVLAILDAFAATGREEGPEVVSTE